MALFAPQQPKIDLDNEVTQLRSQGLTDQQIVDEMKSKGVHEAQVISALNKLSGGAQDTGMEETPMTNVPPGPEQAPMPSGPVPPMPSSAPSPENLYERVEEITESMIDEKWDELIAEVRKIIEWKEKIEQQNQKMNADLQKLKEDFTTLHQAVLGKVEEYDSKMREVGTELKAVGKVFKDVIPVFTENVKELKGVTEGMKKE